MPETMWSPSWFRRLARVVALVVAGVMLALAVTDSVIGALILFLRRSPPVASPNAFARAGAGDDIGLDRERQPTRPSSAHDASERRLILLPAVTTKTA